jgi:hypothetical protein
LAFLSCKKLSYFYGFKIIESFLLSNLHKLSTFSNSLMQKK